jgi:hypothetical protein
MLSIDAPRPGFSNIGANNLSMKNFAINEFISVSLTSLNFFLISNKIILQMHLTEYGNKYKSFNKFSINLFIKFKIF